MFSYQNEIRAWHVNIIHAVCFIVKWIPLMRWCILCPCRYDCCQFSRISLFLPFRTHRLNDIELLLVSPFSYVFINQQSTFYADWFIEKYHQDTCVNKQQSSSSCDILRKVHPVYFTIYTGPLCEEFTGHRWIPLTKASDAQLWSFLLPVPE